MSGETQEQVFDWLTQAMRLLRRLNERFSALMHIWARFNNPGGHIEYLTEMRGREIAPVINALKETFDKFADLHIKLRSLQNELGITKTTVSSLLRISLTNERLTD
jgi:hypothetical protein